MVPVCDDPDGFSQECGESGGYTWGSRECCTSPVSLLGNGKGQLFLDRVNVGLMPEMPVSGFNLTEKGTFLMRTVLASSAQLRL